MRHAAREPADRLELLELAESELELLVRCEVVELAADPLEARTLVEEPHGARQRVHTGTVRRPQLHLALAQSARPGDLVHEVVPSLGTVEHGGGVARPRPFEVRKPEQPRERLVTRLNRTVGGGNEIGRQVGVEELARFAEEPRVLDCHHDPAGEVFGDDAVLVAKPPALVEREE